MSTAFRIIAILCFAFGAHAQGINFEKKELSKALERAASEKKLIFVDAFTSWCGPCKVMARDVFTDSYVADFYNENFVCLKLDVEKDEGVDFGNKYQISCYPSYLFLDSAGNVVHRSAGMMDGISFVGLGQIALKPGAGFGSLSRQFQEGRRDTAFMQEYLQAISGACLSANDEAIAYLASVAQSDLSQPTHWRFIRDYVEDPGSAPFQAFLKSKGDFVTKYGENAVEEKIAQTYLSAARALTFSQGGPDRAALSKLKGLAAASGSARSEEILLLIDLDLYEASNEWDQFFRTAVPLLEHFRRNDASLLNNTSYVIYEHSYRQEELQQALIWARRSVELQEATYSLDTYASLLHKLGRRNEAIEYQEKAVALGKSRGEDVSQLEETLKKFKKSKG